MEKTGYIEIRITGRKGNIELSTVTFDIREIRSLLENAENLLFPGEKRGRPTVSYQLSEGSVRNMFTTTLQYVIGFNAILGQIGQTGSIDFLDIPTAKVIEIFQDTAIKNDYVFSISTSMVSTNELNITKSTQLYRTESIWADAEFYFYGTITNMGGKDKANIHLLTDDLGTLYIQTPKDEIERIENNPLYKTFGIRAFGKQHSATGEIDRSSLKFGEIVIYKPKFDEQYIESLRRKAIKNWIDVPDPDAWIREIRGTYYA
ncbi:MAG: hypothetical protein ISS19_12920 [Bacteroidales bacterium]|nr:hypothetical protein [Bacteroidales bacterium]